MGLFTSTGWTEGAGAPVFFLPFVEPERVRQEALMLLERVPELGAEDIVCAGSTTFQPEAVLEQPVVAAGAATFYSRTGCSLFSVYYREVSEQMGLFDYPCDPAALACYEILVALVAYAWSWLDQGCLVSVLSPFWLSAHPMAFGDNPLTGSEAVDSCRLLLSMVPVEPLTEGQWREQVAPSVQQWAELHQSCLERRFAVSSQWTDMPRETGAAELHPTDTSLECRNGLDGTRVELMDN